MKIGMGSISGVTFKRTGWIGRPAGAKSGREIRPRLNYDICGMCGRTILTGERIAFFASEEDDQRLVVCGHCRQKARESGLSQVG